MFKLPNPPDGEHFLHSSLYKRDNCRPLKSTELCWNSKLLLFLRRRRRQRRGSRLWLCLRMVMPYQFARRFAAFPLLIWVQWGRFLSSKNRKNGPLKRVCNVIVIPLELLLTDTRLTIAKQNPVFFTLLRPMMISWRWWWSLAFQNYKLVQWQFSFTFWSSTT